MSHTLAEQAPHAARSRHATSIRRAAMPCATLATLLCAGPGAAIAQESHDPVPSLRFAPAVAPGPITPADDRTSQDFVSLRFSPSPPADPEPATDENEDTDARNSPLQVYADLMILRAMSPEDEQAFSPGALLGQSTLTFEDAQSDASLWGDRQAGVARINRLELLPAVYLRSGRVHDAGYESLDYADLYAELGVGLTANTGLWLRYERLRQALGSAREGEQVDADALYLQFELRF